MSFPSSHTQVKSNNRLILRFNSLFSIASILPHISAVIESIAAQARIRDEINRIPTIDVRDTTGDKPGSDSWDASIELDGVTFAYSSRPDAKALDDISLKIPAASVTALVGGEVWCHSSQKFQCLTEAFPL
jgi:ATP-binding cassette, subfamily B (MDR/TAP), member 1